MLVHSSITVISWEIFVFFPDQETIFFDSHDVSKPSSSHFLNKVSGLCMLVNNT